MSRFGFCGPSYTLSTPNADCQLAMNLYPESDESGMGKSPIIQLPTPGTNGFAIAPVAGIGRGLFTAMGRTFAVAGTCFYESLSTGATTQWGTVANNSKPVSWAANASQLLISSGGIVYCFTFATNNLAVVTALNGISISQLCYTDAFFLALQTNSQVFYTSALEDGTTWDLGNASAISVFPENVVAMVADHREPWFLGQKASQPYYDSGAVNTPYVPVNGGFIEEGCIAQWSAVKLDNSIFWLDGNVDRGQGIVRRAVGYTPTRVSNHAVEFAIQGYPKISDSVAYGYQENGHSFYVLQFPSANGGKGATWVYDVATGQWHQRAFGDQADQAHRSMAHTFNFGMHLVCDPVTGNINQMSTTLYTDVGGQLIRRVRRAPHISTEQQWIFGEYLQVDVQAGNGPIPPLQGYAPPGTIYLKDSSNVVWAVQVNDSGLFTSVVSSGTPQKIILNDASNSTSWLLGITTGGLLTATEQTFSANPQQYGIVSATGKRQWLVQVITAGNLQTSGGSVVARGPIMNLRWSDDGGHTWSNEYPRDCGQAGQFKKRVMWWRLGRWRDRVFEINMSDPVFWAVTDAYLKAEPGFDSKERLPKQLAKIA